MYVKDGFHSVDSETTQLVSTLIMNSARRTSQSKTTKGWLNSPYSRHGCLRVRKRIKNDDLKKELKIQSGKQVASPYILYSKYQALLFSSIELGMLLGSTRLEIRRISGNIHKNQIHWRKGDDGKGICVFDPEGIELIDDAQSDRPPYIIFDFQFREDPKITRKVAPRMKEENVDTKIGVRAPTCSSTESDTSALSAVERAKGTSFHVRAKNHFYLRSRYYAFTGSRAIQTYVFAASSSDSTLNGEERG